MQPYEALSILLSGLQQLYANEGRTGGTEAAQALGEAAKRLTALPLLAPELGWLPALALDPHPLTAVLQDAAPLIPWSHAGLEDGKIPQGVARQMLTAELIGPTGMLPHDSLRVGLFYQAPGARLSGP